MGVSSDHMSCKDHFNTEIWDSISPPKIGQAKLSKVRIGEGLELPLPFISALRLSLTFQELCQHRVASGRRCSWGLSYALNPHEFSGSHSGTEAQAPTLLSRRHLGFCPFLFASPPPHCFLESLGK